jgi:hypothetical protein
MKRFFVFVIMAFVFLFGHSSLVFAQTELDKVREGIVKNNAQWTAGETSISKLPPEQRRMRLGLKKSAITAISKSVPAAATFMPKSMLPPVLDYTDFNGLSYVTPIRDQGGCGSCWAFATTAVLESQILWNILDLTDEAEQVLLSCSGAGNCINGGSIGSASDFIRDTGLPLEVCFPYTATDESCSDATCPNWREGTSRISSWWPLGDYGQATVDDIRNALVLYGPLVTTMAVYSDFYSYTKGIYSFTSGSLEGYHAIELIGFDDINQCFKVKNSWGAGWGEAGFFRIGYSQISSVAGFGLCSLVYSCTTGSLVVQIAPLSAVDAGAQFNIDGGDWHSSAFVLYGIPAGQHIVNFKSIEGWITPASQTVNIHNGQSANISAEYTHLSPTAFINIYISPPGAVAAGADHAYIDGLLHSIAETVEVSAGEPHTVEFPDAPGWKTPESQNVTLTDGEISTVFGFYTQPAPLLPDLTIKWRKNPLVVSGLTPILTSLVVKNIGEKRSGSFKVAVYKGEKLLFTRTIANLGVKSFNKRVILPVRLPKSCVGQNIAAVVDPDNIILEKEEGNNVSVLSILHR